MTANISPVRQHENEADGERSTHLYVICYVLISWDLLFLQRMKGEWMSRCMNGNTNKEQSNGGNEGGVFTSNVIWGAAGVVLVEVDGMPAGTVPRSVISR